MTDAYIFDLDGTLIDTAPDLLNILNIVMVQEGRREINTTEIRHLVGRGVRNLIIRAFEETGDPVSEAHLDELFPQYLEIYAAHSTDHSQMFPGVKETLEKLHADGVKMAVLTNKPHKIAEALIPAFGLDRFFPVVYGAGKREYLKPDGRLFKEVLADIGGADRAVMVGDSVTDVQTARNAGVPVVLLSYGYTPTPARELGADAVVDHFADVPAAARKVLIK